MIEKDISGESTKEDVAEFYKTKFNVSEEIFNNFIKEFISGDILPYLSEQEFRFLGLKVGITKKSLKYIECNKDKFKEKEINGYISSNSSSEEVQKFLESYLDFKENSNNINGKMLFELKEEDMKKLGMKLGQRKRLIKFIEQINNKSLKKIIDITITKESSAEEVSRFLMEKLNFSEETAENFDFDGESLFCLDEEDMDAIFDELKNEKEREGWAKFIETLKQRKEKLISPFCKSFNKCICLTNIFQFSFS